jgi:dTDP-4-dehydrorhamnose reductase
MRVLVTGAAGQLGGELVRALSAAGHRVLSSGRAQCDLSHPTSVEQIVGLAPQLVVHAAAYTDVDGCAGDPQRAYQVNALGTQYVALACQRLDAPLVYISTNEVFAGDEGRAYFEYDRARPINAYGFSKWAGEEAVRALLTRHYICRVAWLFGGARSFVQTMLRLGGEREELSVVADEVGSPTYTVDVAEALAQLIEQPYYGTYHLVNAGQASRYELAQATLALGGLARVRLAPIAQRDFPRASTPPLYTPLHSPAAAALGIRMRPWSEALEHHLARVRDSRERSVEIA